MRSPRPFATFRPKCSSFSSVAGSLSHIRSFCSASPLVCVWWCAGLFEFEIGVDVEHGVRIALAAYVSLPHKHAHDVNLIIVKFRCASLYLGIGGFRVRKTKVYSTGILSLDQYKFKWAIVKCTYCWCASKTPIPMLEQLSDSDGGAGRAGDEVDYFSLYEDKAHHCWLIFVFLLCSFRIQITCAGMNRLVVPHTYGRCAFGFGRCI